MGCSYFVEGWGCRLSAGRLLDSRAGSWVEIQVYCSLPVKVSHKEAEWEVPGRQFYIPFISQMKVRARDGKGVSQQG